MSLGAELRVGNDAISLGKVEIPLVNVRAVHATTRGPNVKLHLTVLAAAMAIGVPGLAMVAASDVDSPALLAGLVLCSGGAFHSGWRLLTLEERYCVVIETAAGRMTLLDSSDHQLVIRTVADIEHGLRAIRSGRPVSRIAPTAS